MIKTDCKTGSMRNSIDAWLPKRLIAFIFVVFCIPASVVHGEMPGVGDIAIHGFVSQGYMISSDNNFFAQTAAGTFEFNEMGLNFITHIPEYRLRIGAQLFARDLGQIGNDEILLDWAVGEYHWRDWLGITAGKIKVPHGLYNETRDADMLRTFIFLPQGVYNESWRDVIAATKGAGIYGNASLMQAGRLAYRAQIGTVTIDPDSGPALHFNDQVSGGLSANVTDINVKNANAASLQWMPPIENLRFGFSAWMLGFDAKIDTSNLPFDTDFSLDAKAYTFSTEYTWENLVVAAEYTRVNWEIEPTNPDIMALNPGFEPNFYSQGYYISAAYRFAEYFEAGAYYSVYYPDNFDREGRTQAVFHRSWLKDGCLSTRFDINSNWLFKLEGHLMNGTAILLEADNPEGFGLNPHWFLFSAKITFHF